MFTLTRGERFKDARTVHNKNGKQSMEEVYKSTGISASLIKDLEDDDKSRSVGYDKIAILADHYGVSADYLLSITNDPQRSPCATDDLGLSVQSIDWLSLLAKSPNGSIYTKYLSVLFEMNCFQELIRLLIDYFGALKAYSIACRMQTDPNIIYYFEDLEEAAKDSRYDAMTQQYLAAFLGLEKAFFDPGAAMLLEEESNNDVIHLLDILELKIKRNLDRLLRTMEDFHEQQADY